MGVRRSYDWAEVQRYHDAGNGFVACRARFGFSHTAWIKALLSGKLISRKAWTPVSRYSDRRRKYDWSEIQRYYDEGHSYRECRATFGFNAGSWTKAVRRGELRARARQTPLHVILRTSRLRGTIKRRLLEAGILQNVCSACGLSEWRGKPISIQIDHINGVRDDHRVENLRMLCPNCHSQTETFGSRNWKRQLKIPG